MTVNSDVRFTSLSPGAGCAGRFPLASLERLISSMGVMSQATGPELVIGLAEGDDAAAFCLDDVRAVRDA